jgi:hypothetical protein
MTWEPSVGWSFAWAVGKPYITSIYAWSRTDCIREAEKQIGRPWRNIYREGGRVIKTEIRQRETPR